MRFCKDVFYCVLFTSYSEKMPFSYSHFCLMLSAYLFFLIITEGRELYCVCDVA